MYDAAAEKRSVMRTLLIGLGALVGLVLVVALVAPLFFSAESLAALLADEVKKTSGYDFAIKGGARVSLLPSPSLTLGDVHVANAPGATSPEFFKAREISVSVALFPLFSGNVDVKSVRLVAPVVVLETLKDGRPAWLPPQGAKPAPAQKPDAASPAQPVKKGGVSIAIDRVDLTDGSVTQITGDKREVIGAINGHLDGNPAGAVRLAVSAMVRGQAVKADLDLGSLTCGAGGVPIAADITAVGLVSSIKGALACADGRPVGVNGTLMVSGDDLAGVAKLAGMAQIPAILNNKLALKAGLKADQGAVALSDLVLDLGAAHGAGKVAVKLGGRPEVTADLALNRLNLDRLLGKQAALDGASPTRFAALPGYQVAAAGDEPVAPDHWSRAKLPLGWRDALTLSLHLTADGIESGKLALDKADVSLVMKDGQVTVPGFKAGLKGGEIKGALKLGAAAVPPVTLDVTLTGLSVPAMVQGVGPIGVTDGIVSASAALTATGDSVARLVDTLAGTVTVAAKDGVVQGVNLTAVVGAIDAVNELGDLPKLIGMKFNGETKFNSLSATAKIDQGIARIEDGVLKADSLDAGAALVVNLPAYQIDGKITVQVQSKRDLPPLVLDVSGPLDQPKVSPDPGSVQGLLGKTGLGGLLKGLGGKKSTPPPQTDPAAPPPPAEKPADLLNNVLKGLGR